MRFAPIICLLYCGLTNTIPTAAAQTFDQPRSTVPQAVYPSTPFSQYPRAERTLQFVADPFAAQARNRGQYVPYSDHPFIDAAPNFVNLASIALFFGSTRALTTLAFVVPPAIRATRVALYGSPVEGRRDTFLWIIEPTILHVRNHIRERRAGNQSAQFCR